MWYLKYLFLKMWLTIHGYWISDQEIQDIVLSAPTPHNTPDLELAGFEGEDEWELIK